MQKSTVYQVIIVGVGPYYTKENFQKHFRVDLWIRPFCGLSMIAAPPNSMDDWEFTVFPKQNKYQFAAK